MVDFGLFALYLLVMAGTTYLIRAVPLILVKKKIKSRFLKSFLFYMPYAVLSVMTVPAIFFATSSVYSAAGGFVTALVLAYFKKSLITVAASACIAVFVVELAMQYVF